MLIRRSNRSTDIPSSEITPQSVYQSRRAFMAAAAAAGVGAAVAGERILRPGTVVHADTKLQTVKSSLSTPGLTPTSLRDITSYNNYYEFGTSKSDPSQNAGKMQTYPWNVKVEGLVKKPKTYSAVDLAKLRPLEDRIYRFRCVEAWSMVIPWVGYSLSELIKEVEPLGTAKYVQFESYYNSDVMPWSRSVGIDWPYIEGLRMDEAMHPLTLLTFGLYGETLPNQDGAPMRIVVPWKYGYKSAKSIVKIKFVAKQPFTTWMEEAPSEYGFYSNVNPEVDTVQWSQASERVIGAPIWKQRQPTQMFNGYADQVASLYAGMDLKKYY
jgi:sulfoxide reductase catalytic subunit YedY